MHALWVCKERARETERKRERGEKEITRKFHCKYSLHLFRSHGKSNIFWLDWIRSSAFVYYYYKRAKQQQPQQVPRNLWVSTVYHTYYINIRTHHTAHSVSHSNFKFEWHEQQISKFCIHLCARVCVNFNRKTIYTKKNRSKHEMKT